MSAPPIELTATLTGLYAGKVQVMPNDGRPTGIFKQRAEGPLRVTRLGLEGDQQGDPRVHGGPEKALHQYPVPNYARLAERFPELVSAFVPGSMGENLSTPDFDESSVCIGDVFALGSARIQLCQPRTPCWKIDARFGLEGIQAFVWKQGIVGWYFRVLDEGVVQTGDTLRLIDRTEAALTVQQFNSLTLVHRPNVADLLRAANLAGLTPSWAERLRARALWLHHNTIGRSPLADDE